jgi:Na+-translocating ferredoxin:NAD+ oxidoreductase RnfG subunit
MMHIATLVVLGVFALVSAGFAVLSYLIVRQQSRDQHEMIRFSRSLMSRFVASNNLQAEIYCASEEKKQSRNEERRVADATTLQKKEWLA